MLSIRRNITMSVAALAVAAVALTSPALAGKDKNTAKVGEKAPDFTLTDINGEKHNLAEYIEQDKVVVLEWFSPTCPYVVKHHELQSTMADLNEKYSDQVVWLAINSAHEGHPSYAMNSGSIEIVNEWEIEYPVLVDADGKVGHAYGAKTTPHMFIIDTEGVLRYNGNIDNTKGTKAPKNKKKVVNYVAQALDEVLAGETVTMAETKPIGCGVKYAK